MRAPPASSSARSARRTAFGSTAAVSREWSALPVVRAIGSISASSRSSTKRTRAPFAVARRWSSSSAGSSASLRATITLPASRTGSPFSLQKARMSRLPARQVRALLESGA